MNSRHWLCSVVAAAFWLTVAGQSPGQNRTLILDDERAHTPRPDDVKPPYDKAAIQRRLKISLDQNEVDRLVDQLLNLSAQDRDKLARIDRNNPELKRFAEELLRDTDLRDRVAKSIKNKQFPDDAKKLLDDPARARNPDTRPPDAGTQPAKIGPDHSQPSAADKKSDASSPPPPRPTESRANEPSRFKTFLSEAAPQAADLLADLGLKDDAEFLRGLFRGKIPSGNNGYLARAVGRATQVAKELPLDKIASGSFGEVFGNVHMPSLPKFNFSLGSKDTKSSVAPGSASSGGAGVGTGTLLVWVLLALVFVAVLWKGRDLFLPNADRTAGAWKLGPWPVRPESVRTRADLVRAFEYLAFLLLGLAARPRNHLDLAKALAATGEEPIRHTVAARLAHLYERARYAPKDEALPDDELRAARIDLTFLAGASPA